MGDDRETARRSAVGTVTVLVILGLLAAVAIPVVMHFQAKAEEERHHNERVNEIVRDMLNE